MRNEFEMTSLVHTSILLVFFAIAMLGSSRSQLFSHFKALIIWAVIILLVVAAYSYSGNIKNSGFYAALVPGTAIINNEGMELRKADDGHFYLNAIVSGKKIRFMIDTGASDIVLSQKDAENIGIDLNSLEYNKLYSTANGTTRGASVKISYLKAGNYEMHDFFASVNQGQLENSLLGMAFLDKFASYSVEGDRLLLRTKP